MDSLWPLRSVSNVGGRVATILTFDLAPEGSTHLPTNVRRLVLQGLQLERTIAEKTNPKGANEHHMSSQNLAPLMSSIPFLTLEKKASLTMDILFQKGEEEALLIHRSDHQP